LTTPWVSSVSSWGSALGARKLSVGRKRSIVTVVSKYTELKELGGRRFVGVCPIHADNNPSLVVYAESRQDEHFHCFGCHAHGDVIEFVRLVEGCSFEQAVAKACSKGASAADLEDVLLPSQKSLADERLVAMLLLGRYVRGLWFRLPREKWPRLNRLAAATAREITASQHPVETVNKKFLNR